MTTNTTVIGLGRMGTALAGAFLAAGHETTIWNRTPGRDAGPVAKGAVSAATAAEAVAAGDLVVLCVLDYRAVHEILDPLGDAVAGKVIVNLTNGTPEQADATSAWAAGHGAAYLDGGIMAVPQMIAGPGALLLYSGSRDAYERHEDDLAALGTGRYLGDEPGLAALYDLALLTVMYGLFTGYFQAAALVGAERVGEFTAMVMPWLGGMSGSLPAFAAQVEAGTYPTDVSSLDINQAGYANLVAAAEVRGLDLGLFTPVQELLDRAVAAGHGNDSLARLVELISRGSA